jgi:uncharacterized protein (TIRG00374 family)
VGLITIGLMINNILPARAGDMVRPYLLSRKDKIRLVSSLSSVFMERLLDGLSLFMLFLVTCLVMNAPGEILLGVYSAGSMFVAVFALSVVFSKKRETAKAILTGIFSRFTKRFTDRLGEIIDLFLESLSGLTEFSRRNTGVWAVSLVTWLLEASAVYLLFASLGMNLEFPVAVLVLVVTALSTMIPSAPGYIGTFEWFFVFTLSFFGIDQDLSLTAAVLFHAIQYISVFAFSLPSMYIMHFNFHSILEDKKRKFLRKHLL